VRPSRQRRPGSNLALDPARWSPAFDPAFDPALDPAFDPAHSAVAGGF
jgi:hypothetical protein